MIGESLNAQVRRVIAQHARLAIAVGSLGDDEDLFSAGMSSHSSVNVMLALEDAFELEFPDSMLRRSVFENVGSIVAAISDLQGQERAA
jgi:acyl carrier protein